MTNLHDAGGEHVTQSYMMQVVSDIDDTLMCSGGTWPAGRDMRYPRKCMYPGALALYSELDIGYCTRLQQCKRLEKKRSRQASGSLSDTEKVQSVAAGEPGYLSKLRRSISSLRHSRRYTRPSVCSGSVQNKQLGSFQPPPQKEKQAGRLSASLSLIMVCIWRHAF